MKAAILQAAMQGKLTEQLDRMEALKTPMTALFAYYGSEDWFADREGELPENVKAGVLSEDLVYDQVAAIHSAAIRMLELAADIADRGIVLTGGGSLLRGLEDLICDRTGINTMTTEDPMTAVAIGTGKYVEFLANDRE